MALTHKPSTLSIYCDGGARGNPGPAASAFVVIVRGQVVHQAGQSLGPATNNVAEYTAVHLALQWLSKNQDLASNICNFYLDSNLVVNQLNGLFKTKHAPLRELMLKIKTLEQQIHFPVTYTHIPRFRNHLADSLVNRTLDSSR